MIEVLPAQAGTLSVGAVTDSGLSHCMTSSLWGGGRLPLAETQKCTEVPEARMGNLGYPFSHCLIILQRTDKLCIPRLNPKAQLVFLSNLLFVSIRMTVFIDLHLASVHAPWN